MSGFQTKEDNGRGNEHVGDFPLIVRPAFSGARILDVSTASVTGLSDTASSSHTVTLNERVGERFVDSLSLSRVGSWFESSQSRSPFCSTVAVKLHRTLSRLRRLVDIMTGSVQHRARSSLAGRFMTRSIHVFSWLYRMGRWIFLAKSV